MRVLMTGATGELGSRVLPLLVADGHGVTAVSRGPGKDAQVVAADAAPLRLDLFDRDAVRAAVEGHDAVLDLATSIPPLSRMAFASAWKTNDRLRRDASANVADDEPLTRRAHADALGAALGRELELLPRFLTTVGPLSGYDRSVRMANRRFRDASDWEPRYPTVREGWRCVIAARKDREEVDDHA